MLQLQTGDELDQRGGVGLGRSLARFKERDNLDWAKGLDETSTRLAQEETVQLLSSARVNVLNMVIKGQNTSLAKLTELYEREKQSMHKPRFH